MGRKKINKEHHSNSSLALDYTTLIKIFPIALGLSVFANGFMNVSFESLPTLIAFLIIFVLITLDAIIEFGRYDYKKLPRILGVISFMYGFALLSLIISISLYTNDNFNDSALYYIFWSLAFTSFTEAIFSLSLFVLYRQKKILIALDYDAKDAKSYFIWEILFVVAYLLFATRKLVPSSAVLPWMAVILLAIEIFVYNFLRSDDDRHLMTTP